ncbi:MAG: hypothetical protein HZB23_15450 [Deltaproteobacteria bacterium]|nr:hypothetical protein [Deltaproteobacteria bacterium]
MSLKLGALLLTLFHEAPYLVTAKDATKMVKVLRPKTTISAVKERLNDLSQNTGWKSFIVREGAGTGREILYSLKNPIPPSFKHEIMQFRRFIITSEVFAAKVANLGSEPNSEPNSPEPNSELGSSKNLYLFNLKRKVLGEIPSPFSPEEITSESILFKSKFGNEETVPEHLVFNMALLSPPIKRFPVLIPSEVVKVKSPEPPKKGASSKPSKSPKKGISLPFRKPASPGDTEIEDMFREDEAFDEALYSGHPKYWRMIPAQRDYEFLKAYLKQLLTVKPGEFGLKHFKNALFPTKAEMRSLPAKTRRDYTRAREYADKQAYTYETHLDMMFKYYRSKGIMVPEKGGWREQQWPPLQNLAPNDDSAYARWVSEGGNMKVLIVRADIEDSPRLCPENWITIPRTDPNWVAETRKANSLRIKMYEEYLIPELLRYISESNPGARLNTFGGPQAVTNAILDGLLALEYVEGWGPGGMHMREDLRFYKLPPLSEMRFKPIV